MQLELLTGALSGICDPNGMGAMFFAVLAAAAQIERNYIREKPLEGQVTAAAKGNHGGRPKVIDEDMLLFARALKDRGIPVPEIAKKLTIKTGKNAGQHPSVASVYRALAEAEATEAPAGPEIIAPRRPTRVDFTGPGSGTDPELMERLTRQVLGPGAGDVVDTLVEQTEDGTDDVVAALLAQARTARTASDPGRSALVRPTARAAPGSLCGCGRRAEGFGPVAIRGGAAPSRATAPYRGRPRPAPGGGARAVGVARPGELRRAQAVRRLVPTRRLPP
ncbi:hypothetical protein [Streptomyces sioyaensis]|uniref:hypothetical protein n=1 Tax=Streptomyces sioyaensis TaxID=67364 RepID=UPI003716B8F9